MGLIVRLFSALLIITCFSMLLYPAFAGKEESGGTYERLILHPEITLTRILQLEEKIKNIPENKKYINELNSFHNKMVFWTGGVLYSIKILDKELIIMQDKNENIIPVLAFKPLRFDRRGHTIGVKGKVIIYENTFLYLDMWSHLPVMPPENLSYAEFLKENNLSETFTYNNKEFVHPFYPFLCWWIHFYNPKLTKDDFCKIASSIIYWCNYYKIDPFWATALFSVESAFIVDAVSPSGAMGLGQLMPFTAKALGVDPYNAEENVRGSLCYINQHLKEWAYYNDKISRTLASYNAGPGSVYYYGGIPPYSETQNYVYFIKFIRGELLKQFRMINTKT